ncbi:MAG: hypothetical protein A2860_01225 [Candidatus Levybacteria bacterium RIFCSPHIGHO2_01_FULL_37_33]|uniref:DUF4145 domain-containing protein n=1 Tax=Candidatus Zambryskibacteria bacterium RIFCSPHIGHO2_12_FULL_38_37 TaxID=1802751 RepID=A0A1G2TKA8_9BACT|nr:MAG: hypothetical protein A2860_01225 [Candidatus Levybacteria bacterium RIFCSPHIGHO2_01_FULL_37_33]OHA97746.1 MAG: hypothetical protein A3E32_01045 [Candidatus Zambryskibacteria bacterium RIFCSPHIGHO2_12_FULL_38_37]OHB14216.1 MAG: hypothetical protein A3G47_02450 [Candidatus Zambryskibacteria bacterium RIFCSPLOWO2_12_FULL_39_45]
MSENYDQSHLDRKYFVNREKYNCPFCNRKSIVYGVSERFSFDWSNDRTVYGYRVHCGGDTCQKTSLHLSNYAIEVYSNKFWSVPGKDDNGKKITISMNDIDLDTLFFYHQPTTFFTLDNRINEKIRTLVAESEGCAKMNYLVGASGCLRKAIYELLEIEQVSKTDKDEKEVDYGNRVKVLKSKYPTVPPEYFDALANIQGMTSEQLHEGDWKPWTQDEFRFLVETAKEVLTEIYVRPQEKVGVLQKILALKPQKDNSKVPKSE